MYRLKGCHDHFHPLNADMIPSLVGRTSSPSVVASTPPSATPTALGTPRMERFHWPFSSASTHAPSPLERSIAASRSPSLRTSSSRNSLAAVPPTPSKWMARELGSLDGVPLLPSPPFAPITLASGSSPRSTSSLSTSHPSSSRRLSQVAAFNSISGAALRDGGEAEKSSTLIRVTSTATSAMVAASRVNIDGEVSSQHSGRYRRRSKSTEHSEVYAASDSNKVTPAPQQRSRRPSCYSFLADEGVFAAAAQDDANPTTSPDGSQRCDSLNHRCWITDSATHQPHSSSTVDRLPLIPVGRATSLEPIIVMTRSEEEEVSPSAALTSAKMGVATAGTGNRSASPTASPPMQGPSERDVKDLDRPPPPAAFASTTSQPTFSVGGSPTSFVHHPRCLSNASSSPNHEHLIHLLSGRGGGTDSGSAFTTVDHFSSSSVLQSWPRHSHPGSRESLYIPYTVEDTAYVENGGGVRNMRRALRNEAYASTAAGAAAAAAAMVARPSLSTTEPVCNIAPLVEDSSGRAPMVVSRTGSYSAHFGSSVGIARSSSVVEVSKNMDVDAVVSGDTADETQALAEVQQASCQTLAPSPSALLGQREVATERQAAFQLAANASGISSTAEENDAKNASPHRSVGSWVHACTHPVSTSPHDSGYGEPFRLGALRITVPFGQRSTSGRLDHGASSGGGGRGSDGTAVSPTGSPHSPPPPPLTPRTSPSLPTAAPSMGSISCLSRSSLIHPRARDADVAAHEGCTTARSGALSLKGPNLMVSTVSTRSAPSCSFGEAEAVWTLTDLRPSTVSREERSPPCRVTTPGRRISNKTPPTPIPSALDGSTCSSSSGVAHSSPQRAHVYSHGHRTDVGGVTQNVITSLWSPPPTTVESHTTSASSTRTHRRRRNKVGTERRGSSNDSQGSNTSLEGNPSDQEPPGGAAGEHAFAPRIDKICRDDVAIRHPAPMASLTLSSVGSSLGNTTDRGNSLMLGREPASLLAQQPLQQRIPDGFVIRSDVETVQSLPRGKVPRMPGCSMRDWAVHLTTKVAASRHQQLSHHFSCHHSRQKDSTSGQGTSAASLSSPNAGMAAEAFPKGRLPGLSPQEVAAHNTPDDLWIVIRSVVYDCTFFQHFHPGGEKLLLACAGRDATAVYDRFHAWVSCESFLGPYAVGTLVLPERCLFLFPMGSACSCDEDAKHHRENRKNRDNPTESYDTWQQKMLLDIGNDPLAVIRDFPRMTVLVHLSTPRNPAANPLAVAKSHARDANAGAHSTGDVAAAEGTERKESLQQQRRRSRLEKKRLTSAEGAGGTWMSPTVSPLLPPRPPNPLARSEGAPRCDNRDSMLETERLTARLHHVRERVLLLSELCGERRTYGAAFESAWDRLVAAGSSGRSAAHIEIDGENEVEPAPAPDGRPPSGSRKNQKQSVALDVHQVLLNACVESGMLATATDDLSTTAPIRSPPLGPRVHGSVPTPPPLSSLAHLRRASASPISAETGRLPSPLDAVMAITAANTANGAPAFPKRPRKASAVDLPPQQHHERPFTRVSSAPSSLMRALRNTSLTSSPPVASPSAAPSPLTASARYLVRSATFHLMQFTTQGIMFFPVQRLKHVLWMPWASHMQDVAWTVHFSREDATPADVLVRKQLQLHTMCNTTSILPSRVDSAGSEGPELFPPSPAIIAVLGGARDVADGRGTPSGVDGTEGWKSPTLVPAAADGGAPEGAKESRTGSIIVIRHTQTGRHYVESHDRKGTPRYELDWACSIRVDLNALLEALAPYQPGAVQTTSASGSATPFTLLRNAPAAQETTVTTTATTPPSVNVLAARQASGDGGETANADASPSRDSSPAPPDTPLPLNMSAAVASCISSPSGQQMGIRAAQVAALVKREILHASVDVIAARVEKPPRTLCCLSSQWRSRREELSYVLEQQYKVPLEEVHDLSPVSPY